VTVVAYDPAMAEVGVVFVHGSGRSGRSAWPQQVSLGARRDCYFLERVAPGDPPASVIEHVVGLGLGRCDIVGHSYGVITALMLAQRHPELVRSLALVEPAALALSQGMPATDAHVAAMAPVFAQAGDTSTSDEEFSTLFAAASGMLAPKVPADVLSRLVAQLRALTPPWTLPVDPAVVARVPTLVVASAPDSMYGEVAAVLGEHGARVGYVPGSGHRPHDGEAFNRQLEEFWQSLR